MTYANLSTGTLTNDKLLAGPSEQLAARKIIVEAGQVLPRGSVLGMVIASGEYRLSVPTVTVQPDPIIDPENPEAPPTVPDPIQAPVTDGSQTPDVILADSVDATFEPQEAIAYTRGDFAASALTLGVGHTLESIQEPLRERGIFILNIVD